MTMRLKSILGFVLCLLLASSCGSNNGTPSPDRNSDNAMPNYEFDLTSAVTSRNAAWKLMWVWTAGPRMGGEETMESMAIAKFVDAKGQAVDAITDVKVTAWMPEHMHDTGSEQPIVTVKQNGVISVANIRFFMTGPWEMIVRGRVAGAYDEVRFPVEIKD